MFRYQYCVVGGLEGPLCLDPSDGVFGRFDLAALLRLPHLKSLLLLLLLLWFRV